MGTKKLKISPYHPQTNGQWKRFNSTLINILGTLPPECKSEWKGSIGALAHAYNCTQNSAMDFSPYFLMYRRQPQLPINVSLGLTPKLITVPTSTKYIQKLREHIRQTHRKADLFQQKEVWCHKCYYDKWSKAVSLRMGDMVLVHITAFKGRHKIQSRWEGREYVVVWQPYPNLPVYVVCPIDGEGPSHTLQWNFLLPISHNLGQDECEEAVEGDGNNGPNPVPPKEDALPVNSPTKS